MQTLTDKQRIEQLAHHDSTVAACMEMYRRGAMTYETMLEGLVVLLVQQKGAAVAYAADAASRYPQPFIVDRDQLPLELAPAPAPAPVPGHVSEHLPSVSEFLAKS